jgi:hypothetical protein
LARTFQRIYTPTTLHTTMPDLPQDPQASGASGQPNISTQDLAAAIHVVMQAMGQQQETAMGIQQLLQQSLTKPTETRCNIRMPTFNASRPEEYPRFEQAARDAICANRWTWPTAGYAIRSALEGKALDIAKSAKPESYPDCDSFLAALRDLFVSPDSRQKAYAQFMTRIQGPGEELAVYHSLLQDLWEKAFETQERSEARLINQFIAGLSHPEANKQLRMEQAVGRLPTDYRSVLIQASNITSQCSLIQQDAQRKAAGGRWSSDLSIQPPTTWNRVEDQGPVPMEIGLVTNAEVNTVSFQGNTSTKYCSFHNSTTHTTQDCRAQRPQGQSPTMWCSFHNVSTHNTSDCRVRQAQTNGQTNNRPPNFSGRTPPAGTSRPLQTGINNKPRFANTRGPGPNPTDKCSNCGGIGHWRAQCPTNSSTSRQHQTNTVEEHEYANAEN